MHRGHAEIRPTIDSASSLEASLETVPESVTSLWMLQL